jgi:hypothetical protein
MPDVECATFAVAKLSLSPADTLVVKYNGTLTPEDLRKVQLYWKEILPLDCNLLVLDENFDISVLSRKEVA